MDSVAENSTKKIAFLISGIIDNSQIATTQKIFLNK